MIKRPLVILIFFLLTLSPQSSFAANKVELVGGPDNWKLMLNGKEFFVKGLCWGVDLNKENEDYYFGLVKELGANTIRVWGIGGETQYLMDALAKHGLMMDLGIWLQQHGWVNYVNDDNYKEKTLREIEENVRRFRDHPALLMWNIGNEVIFTLKTEKEKIAFAKYLEEICRMVHKLDPDHPIVSTSAWAFSFPYFKEYTPSLDIYGTNCFGLGGILKAREELKKLNVDRPYLVTEFGNTGDWEAPKDLNGQPIDLSDVEKAQAYRDMWQKAILTDKDKNNLGGFAFIFGDKEDFGGVWYNLFMNGKKRMSYWVVRELFTGQKARNLPAQIQEFTMDKTSGIEPGEKIIIKLVALDPEGDSLDYEFKISGLAEYGNKIIKLESEKIYGNTFAVKMPVKEGVYRIYAYVTDGKENLTIEGKSGCVGLEKVKLTKLKK